MRSPVNTSRQPFLNPLQDDVVFTAVSIQSQAASVRHLAGWFCQQQTAFGRTRKDAASACFLDDGGVIEVGIKSQQRKLETTLTAGLAVTGTLIAALSSQNRLDVVVKVNRSGRRILSAAC